MGDLGEPLAGIPGQSFRSQGVQVSEFVKKKASSSKPGGGVAKKSLCDYQDACLDTDAGALVSIRFKHKTNPSVFKEVTRGIQVSDTFAMKV